MTDFTQFSEQDTVDTLILPYLATSHGFPRPDSLDYQAQHSLPVAGGGTGRYDGLYLKGGYPYAVLEAKRFSRDLTSDDEAQGIDYATSDFFDRPVPYVVVSNGRDHSFFKITGSIDPRTGKPAYARIPATNWSEITKDNPGEVRQLLTERQLLDTLKAFKQHTTDDILALFVNPSTRRIDPTLHPLGVYLENIVTQRQTYAGDTTSKSASKEAKRQQSLRQAIESVALHFTVKILFIKLIEDLARGGGNERVIHSLFPSPILDSAGGLFGYKVLASLNERDSRTALKLYVRADAYYKKLSQQIARVSWQDIFRYGFNVHMGQYGQLFRARDYDRFLPNESTLEDIRNRLIAIDIRTAVIYGAADKRSNVIGDIYERLIDDELRTGLGAVYTPDITMKFMVGLARSFLGGFRGKKILEPACGSGHFYREIYREYVDEVFANADLAHQTRNAREAHNEALRHVFGRDIDPFAVQLTLLSTFLEQLKDNVSTLTSGRKTWLADLAIDTQNSLDPVTIDPDADFGFEQTLDLSGGKSRRASAKRALDPDLVIGNPPYGVAVVPGPRYDTLYSLQSSDSYGYFIVNGLERVKLGGRVIFIVSSSFLTIGTHRKLRKYILQHAKVVRIIKLHRATFPGIDIFPVIIELERCDDESRRNANSYQFYDLWRLNPKTHGEELSRAYRAILDDTTASKAFPFEASFAKRYTIRQGAVARFGNIPLFEAKPSLYEFMTDEPANMVELSLSRSDGATLKVSSALVRGRHVVKLKDIAQVKFGLQSGNNGRFYRSAPGVRGGATKGGYQTVDVSTVMDSVRLQNLSQAERENGVQVDDRSTDKYMVPLDKAGTSDIDGGLLPLFWRPVEFFVDWSQDAVSEMKGLPSSVFRNPQFYFRQGISFSNTGIYSPTFRLGHGGVFDQTGSNIFCDVLDREVLLAILSSTLIKYFCKSFINHSVHAQLDDLPIVLPSPEETMQLRAAVEDIISEQKVDQEFDYRPRLQVIDSLVETMYGVSAEESEEIRTWYRRHYPKLTGDGEDEA